MKLSQSFFKTYREAPSDAEIKSHKLLVRAGYIKKESAGSYIYLPLGIKVLHNIENVVREEMDNAGAIEVLMPELLPQEVYALRLDKFGHEMFRLKDRGNHDYCLGPTHEEVFTTLVKDSVTSYKQLPLTLYQIQTKFRDEVRPRFGLQRAKEFLMKDAYSFHVDGTSLTETYNKMRDAYSKVFSRLGLDVVPVDADTGAIGGSGSQEFMAKNDVGEDEIAVCENCSYAANIEKASVVYNKKNSTEEKLDKKLVVTPKVKTIEELLGFFNSALNTRYPMSKFLKAVVYKSEESIVVAFVRGDREVEETKIINHFDLNSLEMACVEDINNINSVAGFVGPFGLKNCKVVIDNEVLNMTNFICGANQSDMHYVNFNISDIDLETPTDKESLFADIRKVVTGDVCPECGGSIKIIRGIEVGHIFKLGQKYSRPLECKCLDENGKSQYMEMGCYGIGVSRTLSAIVEQYADDKGIVWPDVIAPYKVEIVVANTKDKVQSSVALDIYKKLTKAKIDVLLDDRLDSFGVKLNDAELIGMPNILIVGRGAQEGKVELIDRRTLLSNVLTTAEAIKLLKK